MDNSNVLLDASTANICSKFLFVESDDRELAEAAIYTLPSIQGNFLMLPNTDDEESEINLELLFGAALTDPEKIKGMFHPKQNDNDTRYLFSAPRFVNLCRKEMVESWKANLLRFVMMYGIMAIAFVWNGYFRYNYPQGMIDRGVEQDPIWYFELTIFLWAMVIMGLLSASFVMERMKTKTNRIAVLMTPATMFEKFLSRWLVFTFGFLIVFLIAFKLADWTRVMIYMVSYPELKGVIASAPLSYLGNSGYYWTGLQTWDGLLMALSGILFCSVYICIG